MILCHKGYPLLIHSDAAREFLSTAMASLCAITGMKQTTTKAHNPQGNATIERVWAFVGKCLKLNGMPPRTLAKPFLEKPPDEG